MYSGELCAGSPRVLGTGGAQGMAPTVQPPPSEGSGGGTGYFEALAGQGRNGGQAVGVSWASQGSSGLGESTGCRQDPGPGSDKGLNPSSTQLLSAAGGKLVLPLGPSSSPSVTGGSDPCLPSPGALNTRPPSLHPDGSSLPALCSLMPGLCVRDAVPDPDCGLSGGSLPSSREPSLVTHSWLVRFLCLSLGMGLIRPGHNFLMRQLPPLSDWEFLWGWGQGTKLCSEVGPSSGSGPEDMLGVGARGPSPQMWGSRGRCEVW